MRYNVLSPEEAAALIAHGETLGVSGFTAAGSVKVVPAAIARKAEAEHAAGRDFKVNVLSGASTTEAVDGALAAAEAVQLRVPYQSSPTMRRAINSGQVSYVDMHLSSMAQAMRLGFLPKVTTAIIEACHLTDDGEITLTASLGNSAVFCEQADRIILELNSYHKPELKYIHDVCVLSKPPYKSPLAISAPEDRIGTGTLKVDPRKIVGVVHTHEADHLLPYKEPTEENLRIGRHIAAFLAQEYRADRLPCRDYLLLQSGVGNISNAALKAIGDIADFPPVKMYTEVLQDSALELIRRGRCLFASSCSLALTDEMMSEFYANFDFYRDKILLRPQEISNCPEIAHRLGTICMNAAIEVDLFGNVNSTHVCGSKIMNGVGGSGDYARSAALTIFMCPSVAKGGAISSIVPMVSHTDHPEHDVDVVVTEYGVADLRGKSDMQKSVELIKVAHPDYRPMLTDYLRLAEKGSGQTHHCLSAAFAMHDTFLRKGDMRLTDWAEYIK